MLFEIRGDRSPQGPRRLVAERCAYLDLVAQGMGTAQACRVVGINRRTGYRWRQGRVSQAGRDTGRCSVPPSRVEPEFPVPEQPPETGLPVPATRFLSSDERLLIADLVRAGHGPREIGRRLGRPASTVSRELDRNADPASGEYRPYSAQARAEARRPRPKPGKIATNPELRDRIQDMLDDRCSPEQASKRLRRDHPDQPELHVAHETIYQALYVQGRGELRRELKAALRTGRTQRKPRGSGEQRQPRFTAPMVMISDRPAEADDRAVPGHWEGDLIIGENGASAIGTLVERTTRYVMLVHLGQSRTAEHVRDALITTISTLPEHLRRSLTWDQGAEMARHHEFSIATAMPVYFCDPHAPWQRGTNENTNGLLREYFPKSTDLSIHTPDDLAAVAAQLNRRPRKTLDWDTPAERLAKLLAKTS
ncbi:IS30 family transposase [Amycolatopsis coloradensis]|uniref:IS30 family transposase n=2 Tax=Amycolatopsis coloradensis TaxID=76021 RepID=A0A1R0KV80_9PSEU|nr:IS30 family transposase [Amycolatopsis coloradensis]